MRANRFVPMFGLCGMLVAGTATAQTAVASMVLLPPAAAKQGTEPRATEPAPAPVRAEVSISLAPSAEVLAQALAGREAPKAAAHLNGASFFDRAQTPDRSAASRYSLGFRFGSSGAQRIAHLADAPRSPSAPSTAPAR